MLLTFLARTSGNYSSSMLCLRGTPSVYPEFRSSLGRLSSPELFLTYIEMDMNTSGIGALLISVYKKYGAVLFEGVDN